MWSPSGLNNLTSHKTTNKENNMDDHERKVHDENKEIHQIPNKRSYEEVAAENEYLARRVLELLSANAELEKKKSTETPTGEK